MTFDINLESTSAMKCYEWMRDDDEREQKAQKQVADWKLPV